MILSAQATDKSVNLATRTLVQAREYAAGDPRRSASRVCRATSAPSACTTQGEERHRDVPHPARTARRRVPESREALEALPGVGRKTANVILNTAFGQPTIAVDTHIFRVANRTGLAPGENVRAVEDHLLKVVPRGVPARCASLADPARPLHVRGAQAEVSRVPDPRAVRVPREDALGDRPLAEQGAVRGKTRRRADRIAPCLFSTTNRATQLRRVYVEAWRKRREGLPIEPLEAQVADVIALHPEYHAALERARRRARARLHARRRPVESVPAHGPAPGGARPDRDRSARRACARRSRASRNAPAPRTTPSIASSNAWRRRCGKRNGRGGRRTRRYLRAYSGLLSAVVACGRSDDRFPRPLLHPASCPNSP